jgi:hypothetical protein
MMQTLLGNMGAIGWNDLFGLEKGYLYAYVTAEDAIPRLW